MAELQGYRGDSLKGLMNRNLAVGDAIRLVIDEGELEGVLMPRYELADDKHIVIKLKSGYNIGVDIFKIKDILKVAEGQKPSYLAAPVPMVDEALPRVSIISTGGTIASRVDYRTGGVRPALSASELYATVPELAAKANVEAEVLFSIYSENMTCDRWTAMAERSAEKVKEAFRGIVLTHGTDTMGYTSAALSFALQDIPIPLILVGAQRSSDRPSSDASLNLMGAVAVAAEADFSGVYVLMHAGMGDDVLALHLGTKVRKNHTSRRDAFESVNCSPVAYLRDGRIEKVSNDLPPRRDGSNFSGKTKFERRVALIKFHPNFDPSVIDHYVDHGYRGIVLEGSGLGHVNSASYNSLRKAIDSGVLIAMTSQCIWGRVRMTVYDTGRDLLTIGVIPLEDMLPETAFVKMMWALANSKDLEAAKELMVENLVGEISRRSPLERRPS